jgi:outer membrane immunogenic protein
MLIPTANEQTLEMLPHYLHDESRIDFVFPMEGLIMRKTVSTLAGLAALSLVTSQALAADMGRPMYKAPMAPPAPIYNWTGCYVGVNVGGAFANIDVTDVTTGASASRTSDTGVAGGGQIGCDYQMSQWVVGIRNMFDGTSIKGSRSFTDPGLVGGSGTVDTKVHWFDALTARGGYLVQPNLLFYVQGGAAWTEAKATVFDSTGAEVGSLSRNSRTGWTVGGGAEWMFVPQWSVFVEYNYMGFGTRSSSFQVCSGCDVFSAKANIQDVLVGVNYKF